MSTLARGFGTFIAICFAIISYIMYAQYKGVQGKVDLLLGACILSARENQKQRTGIRDTWLKSANISADNSTLVRFVVGSHPCPVHPEDRVDQFGCQERTPVIFEDMEGDFEGFIENETVKDSAFRHITIRALFPVILKRLGIQEIIPLSADPLVVSLFKESDEIDMATVKFSLFDPGIVHNGFRYQPISPLLLQKGIQVELSLTDSDKSQETSGAKVSADYLDLFKDGKQSRGSKLQKGPGVLLIEAMRDDGTIVELQNSSQNSLLSFMYSIHDVQSLKRHVAERDLRIRTWKSKMAAEQKSLMEEAGVFQDLLLVDVVDVYRTLPAKLLECHVWFAGNFRAAHILKTDDDTYLDLMQAVSILSSVPLVSREWWGNFRREWTVERFGKWREPDYASLAYPPFACGSGYVVSHILHQWLAANSRYLHSFQGEDVSMGIWLAPLAPRLLQDSRWQCFKTCQDSMLTMPELTPTDLATHWSNKLHCSSPCSSC